MYSGKTKLYRSAGLASALLLAGCGQLTSQSPPAQPSYAYAATVPVTATDTQSSVEARYGGTVVVWQPGAGFAVLGLAQPLSGGAVGTLSLNGASTSVTTDTNSKIFSASGTSSAWRGQAVQVGSQGRASVWSGGRASVWSGGSGTVGGIPENSASWKQIGLPVAWAAAPKLGEGVKVAVIDSGIDLRHDMFQGSLVSSSDQWDFVGNDAIPQEEGGFTDEAFGHGTNVAGIVLQVAPHAKIMPLRVLNPDGSGDETNVAQAIDFAVQHGAQIINLSLGSVQKTDVIQKMIQFATLKGVYVIASSGNTGDGKITYPAAYAEDLGTTGLLSLSVGSVNAQDQKSDFSTYGDKLEVVAPGEIVWGPVPGNLFSYWSGTSMASPMVAGTIALARGQNSALDLNTLTTLLLKNTTNINALNPKYVNKLGGRLNAGAFVKAATSFNVLPFGLLGNR